MPGVKTTVWAIASFGMTAATVSYAAHTRQQFYPTVVFLVTSKFSVVILGNFCVLMTVLFGHFMKMVFLGRLREVEMPLPLVLWLSRRTIARGMCAVHPQMMINLRGPHQPLCNGCVERAMARRGRTRAYQASA